MARVGQAYMPAYKKSELGFGMLRRAFADSPHKVYLVYDDQMDQLIVRLVDPSVFASEYYISDEVALLVRESDREIVGFTIVNFESEYLGEKAPRLRELWQRTKLAEHLRQYRKITYEPESRGRRQTCEKLEQRIVAYSAYQSKAAAELIMA